MIALDVVPSEFRFEPGPHLYYLGDRILPGITGILKDCGYIDTTYYTEAARTRGSHVHQAIYFLNKGTLDWTKLIDDTESGKTNYLGYVLGFQKFAREWDLKIEGFEVPLYHPKLLFAGTPDIWGTVLGGIPAIIEMKTGPVPKWGALQTAAQALLIKAHEKVPTNRRRWGLQLNADSTYSKPVEFKEYSMDEAVFKTLNSAVQNRERYT